MVDGQRSKMNVGAIIQARMKSTRLPGKILLPLPYSNGKPLLWWIVQGISRSRMVNKIVLASSKEKENDPLVTFCATNSISLFRGSETDVLSRFVQIIRDCKFDLIVRFTGDNPIVDPILLDQTINYHIANQNDYTYTSGLPLGMNFEVVSAKALLSLESQDLQDSDHEHVTLYIRNHTQFKKGELKLFEEKLSDKIRLTIDYPSDFAMMSLIFSMLKEKELANFDLILKLREESDWLFEINRGNRQKQQYNSDSQELSAAITFLRLNDFKRTSQILERFKLE